MIMIAVCLLYVGRLKEGLERLEKDITQDPSNIQVNIDKTLIIFLSILMWIFTEQCDVESVHPVRAGVQLCHSEEDWDVGTGVSIQHRFF